MGIPKKTVKQLNPVADQTIAKILMEHSEKPACILDAGCGTGSRLLLLSDLFPSAMLYGIDRDHEQIRAAVKQLESVTAPNAADPGRRIKLSCQDASAMSFPKESFDLILCECTFSLFEHPAICLSEFDRVLKNGGSLLLSDLYTDTGEKEKTELPAARILLPESMLCRYLYPKEILEQLLTKKFQIITFNNCTRDLKQMAAQAYMDGDFDCAERGMYTRLRNEGVRYGLWILRKGL